MSKEKPVIGIYQIRNVVNEKVYVGSSKNIKQRWENHLRELRRQDHKNKYLQWSYDKYGEDSFSFEILCVCDTAENLYDLENFYIREKKSADRDFGYNIFPAAEGSLGYKYTDEQRNNISKARKGIPVSEEAKIKISEKNRGQKRTKHFSEITSKRQTGSGNSMAKLKDEDVREIKVLLRDSNLSMKDIANIFGVTSPTIFKIKKEIRWANVTIE